MFVTVIGRYDAAPYNTRSKLFLTWNEWNDYNYRTLFGIFYIDEDSKKHDLGSVKIAQYGQKKGPPKLTVGDTFNELGPEYFSLGAFEYYEGLNKLGDEIRIKVLKSLKDIARFPDIFDKAMLEPVTQDSLLRSVSETEITGQYRRMAGGGAALTPYDFIFDAAFSDAIEEKLRFYFEVIPNSNPPTNIHVLIGRNSSGKTTLLKNMVGSLLKDNESCGFRNIESISLFGEDFPYEIIFPVLINVSFSAFDDSKYHTDQEEAWIKYYYIGLKKSNKNAVKSPSDLDLEFYDSLNNCRKRLLVARWKNAIKILESDSNFRDEDISSLIDPDDSITDERQRDQAFKDTAIETFSKLSSGHKIVLLTITRLVELVEEKALVLIDEPEIHLHPPLLSAFTTSLSDLLTNRNGVAIIATHSPVIMQEVPKSCVLKLIRNGDSISVNRLRIESFGENVGTLTHEVFNLEVTNSGFHKRLKEIVAKTNSYEEAIEAFKSNLGLEAKAMLHSLFYQKENGPRNDTIN
jgi:predicted ATPase